VRPDYGRAGPLGGNCPGSGRRGSSGARLDNLRAVKAHVRGGRIVVDDPTDLPEGTELRLVLADEGDEGDDFDDEERAALHEALDEAEADIDAGRVVTEEEVWATLRTIK
jgi:hypothetical protein